MLNISEVQREIKQDVSRNGDGQPGDDHEEIVDRWPVIDRRACYGLAWDVVEAIQPHTEADPIATLAQFMLGFSNMIGRGAHFTVGATRHHLNLFVALVGTTSTGRKGSSWDDARWALEPFDRDWARNRIQRGLVSGEGLIHHVRDPVFKAEVVKEKGKVVGRQEVLSDEGVSDKRLLVIESEMARVLKAMNRDSNTLSEVIKQAWDNGDLGTMAKNSPGRATGAYVSIICHVTRADVARHLTKEDSCNGFANRFLWLAARKSKELPDGGDLFSEDFAREWEPIKHRLEQVVDFARGAGHMRRDHVAKEIWHGVYRELAAGKAGLLGATLGRAEPQVMRLACVYALLDQSDTVGPDHLTAALALWKYSEDSARYIFGDSLGNPAAEKLLAALREAPDGLKRSEIFGVFHGKKSVEFVNAMLEELLSEGMVHRTKDPSGGGRRAERWRSGRGQ